MTDLVVVSLEAWDGVWRRNQHLVDGLLRSDPGLRVLFVEPAVDPLHAIRLGAQPRTGKGLRVAPKDHGYDGRLWLLEPTKWLPRRVDPRTDRRWAARIERAARRLRMASPLLWVNDPTGAELLGAFGAQALYDVTDDWTVAHRTPAETARVVRQERELLGRCAEVVVCSADLARSKGADRDVTLVPNGVDLAAYRTTWPRPAVLPAGPVVLYVGTLHRDRLDVELTVATARAVRGRAEVVLAGPVSLQQGDVSELASAGAILLGPQDRGMVPALLQHADVLVVPHVVSAFTESLDPIKLYEYAAAGRPVVSTPVSGFRDDQSGRVTVAAREDFPAAVSSAVVVGWVPSVHRPEDAAADWGGRVQQMSAVLARLRKA